MGKKKNTAEKQLKDVEKGKKTYSLPAKSKDEEQKETVPKLQIPVELEKEILKLILENQMTISHKLSGRITSKKLTDIYTSLAQAGFTQSQIERCMNNTTAVGGDLIDALDWLCLNLPNENLPDGFSTVLKQEENKIRLKFEKSLQELPAPSENTATSILSTKSQKEEPSDMKSWILQYAEGSSDDECDDDEIRDLEEKYDVNSQYLELTAKLLDAKEEASQAKAKGDNSNQKKISQKIRDLVLKMNELEKQPDFNPAVKIKDVEAEKSTEPTKPATPQPSAVTMETEEGDLGFSVFEETASKVEEKAVEDVVPDPKYDVRQFEYTRQQWTGKSPKQFLIDWCRKHKAPDPKYEKHKVKGNLWRSRVRIDRKKEGMVDVCPDIVCENIKEAEHLASTLALYQLCKGQSVHQLLPPPYRALWIEWMDAEKAKASKEKVSENKPRDQYIARLMKQIQLKDKETQDQTGDDEEDVDTWESLEDKEITFDGDTTAKCTEYSRKLFKNKAQLKNILIKNQESGQYHTLLKARQTLPVYQYKNSIVKEIQNNSVVVIAGETGSGKSTQVPHFILEALVQNEVDCNIVVTEPRRISTVSLATRVSQEMGESSVGRLCGYQIRFESKYGPNTRLTYCTTGVLLRRLQGDPSLADVTHIVVDEVHERSMQSDFLLTILRRLMNQRSDLKVILMSATLDSKKFSAYFNHCLVINIPGRTFPVKVYHIEDIIEKTKYVLDEDSNYALRSDQIVREEQAIVAVTGKGGDQKKEELYWTKEDITKIDLTTLPSDLYCLRTRNAVSRLNQDIINYDLIIDLLLYLEKDEELRDLDGSVLIFLPGLAQIQELHDLLLTDPRFSNMNRYHILALHSVLSSDNQSAVFQPSPPGVRKIIIATNIAETGITIPDVVFVIDSGKVKENRYIETSQMSALKEVFISKASAKQRQGRAGRVREGFTFRLFSKEKYESLQNYTTPEIQRVPLEELCLHILKCDLGDPEEFLLNCLDPPRPQVIAKAVRVLYEIGACRSGPVLTPLGHHLAALPVNVRIGKMLLFGAIFGYLEPVAVIAAAMTTKSPFVAPIQKIDLAQAAKMSFAVSCSDHLTVYRAYAGWRKILQDTGSDHQYCQKFFLKRLALLEIENLKNDLISLVKTIGFSDSFTSANHKENLYVRPGNSPIPDLDPHMVSVVKAVIAAGLYPNVAKVSCDLLQPSQSHKACVAETSQGPAHVHPSSVNHRLVTNGWIAFQEKVTTSKIYLRECSLVSAFSLLLFGYQINVDHLSQTIVVDDRIVLKAYARTGVVFKELRQLLESLLEQKLNDPSMPLKENQLIVVVKKLLHQETKTVL